jgi:hypothetical protein
MPAGRLVRIHWPSFEKSDSIPNETPSESGASQLVKYLAECGLETHISRNPNFWWDENAAAGLENLPLPDGDSPYVIKSPWLFECVEALVERKDITVDAVILPVRNLV